MNLNGDVIADIRAAMHRPVTSSWSHNDYSISDRLVLIRPPDIDPTLDDVIHDAIASVNQAIEQAYVDQPLPIGWHYEASLQPVDLWAKPIPTQMTWDIVPTPDDPLVAALVREE